jgi:alkaline phosphatase D
MAPNCRGGFRVINPMKFRSALLFALVLPSVHAAPLPGRIAFGSCSDQNKPQPVLTAVVKEAPDLFLYLGDNIYGDTEDMNLLAAKYRTLGARPEFIALRAAMPVLAVWDDHDYGANDAGREYPRKAESKELFQDFWQVGLDRSSRTRPGIYDIHTMTDGRRTLQVILLDTRTFRDPLKRNPKKPAPGSPWKNDYEPDPDPAKTLLGAEQWAWLEQQLRQPADLRLVCSSIQFGHEYNGWESWTNLPAERQRMTDLIRATRANGVVFLSGDVHWGEISRRMEWGDQGYALHDVTASGINKDWHNIEPNRHRVGHGVPEHHFGLMEIDWGAPKPVLEMHIVNQQGQRRVSHRVGLDSLVFPGPAAP